MRRREAVLAGATALGTTLAGCGRLTGREIPRTGSVAFENDSRGQRTAAITVTGPDGETVFDGTLTAGGRRIESTDPVVTEPGSYDVTAAVEGITAEGVVTFEGPELIGYVLVFYQEGDLTVLGPT